MYIAWQVVQLKFSAGQRESTEISFQFEQSRLGTLHNFPFMYHFTLNES